MLLYNSSAVLAEEYVGRLSVSEKRVTLHSVRMTDEGSFTVKDRDGKVKRRNCLNVRGEQGSALQPVHHLSALAANVSVELLTHSFCLDQLSGSQQRLDFGAFSFHPDFQLDLCALI